MVGFTVAMNPSAGNRSGTIQLGDQTFTINQTAAACGFSLETYGAAYGDAGTMSATIVGSPSAVGCSPAVGADQSFLSLIGLTGPANDLFTETYSVSSFNSLVNAVRVGTITFGGQLFTVKQTSY